MIAKTRAASVSSLGSEFDAFLFAPIGEEGNGMLLSVLSALARLDVDPWEEAAKLARLPGEAAIQQLTSLIAALPDRSSGSSDPATIATRLIALLPSRAESENVARRTPQDAEAPIRSPAVTYAIYCAIFVVLVLIGRWLVGGD